MSARDELAAMRGELAELVGEAAERDDDDWMTEAADAILAAGYRKPEQITTIEQLRALPDKTIGITHDGYAFKINDMAMFWPGTDDFALINEPDYADEIKRYLPATIVYTPGA